MALNKEDKEWLQLNLKPIELEIKTVRTHLSKINGSVQKHEKTINEAIIKREVDWANQHAFNNILKEIPDRVESLEDNQRDARVTKRFVVKTVGVTGTILGVIWGIIHLIEYFGAL